MTIRALSLQEFARLNAARARVARHTAQAVEWFADDAETVLGAIAYHHLDLDWSLVVLRRDDHGTFQAVYRAAGLPVLDEARRLLVEQMETALTTDAAMVKSLSVGAR
jgi:hypothetical protein